MRIRGLEDQLTLRGRCNDTSKLELRLYISKIKVLLPSVGLIVVSPKRCGHLLGKTVTSREEYASRISAACAGKSNLPSAPVIIARYLPPPKIHPILILERTQFNPSVWTKLLPE